MQLPLTILDDLSSETKQKWERQFVQTGRQKHEGIWRRTQEPATQKYSHYQSEQDGRWKLAHFFDSYELRQHDNVCSLLISQPYMWWNTALPKAEAQNYFDKTIAAMRKGKWQILLNERGATAHFGDLKATIKYMSLHEAERLAGRKLPEDYQILDIEVFGPTMHLNEEERQRPWAILETGIRTTKTKGSPTVVTDSNELDIRKYLPFQLELGCGPSIEAGVPPLAYLHTIYAVSNPKTHEYRLGDDDDLPVRYFSDTQQFYLDASRIYASSLQAQPTTKFYKSVKRLFEEGKIIDPVFTNNYDGLISDIGMTEYYLRKFEDAQIFPDVDFAPEAKALVVVGSHADRRKLQEKARAAGLQVIYVDPESYIDDEGVSFAYGLESPQDEDIVIRLSAEDFATNFLSAL